MIPCDFRPVHKRQLPPRSPTSYFVLEETSCHAVRTLKQPWGLFPHQKCHWSTLASPKPSGDSSDPGITILRCLWVRPGGQKSCSGADSHRVSALWAPACVCTWWVQCKPVCLRKGLLHLMLLEAKVVRCACIKWKSHVVHCERGCAKFVSLSHDLVELNWFFFFFF